MLAAAQYQTTLARAALGVFVGAAVGAACIAGPYLIALVAASGVQAIGTASRIAGAMFITAFLCWTTGILLCALPWWRMHRRGLRSLRDALYLSVAVTFVAGAALFTRGFGLIPARIVAAHPDALNAADGHLTAWAWMLGVVGGLVFAMLGALVGAAVWRVAYRQTPAAP